MSRRSGRLAGWKPLPTPSNYDGPAFVFERESDGVRVHVGGLIRWDRFHFWSSESIASDADPIWRLAQKIEPTRRRAIMLFVELHERVDVIRLADHPIEARTVRVYGYDVSKKPRVAQVHHMHTGTGRTVAVIFANLHEVLDILEVR